MPKTEDDRLTTLEIRQQAKPEQLARELREAVIAATAMNVFTRMEVCHNTRRCCWQGQQPDGRRGPVEENDRMFRWKGAPDLRIPLADTVIRRLMLIRAGVVNRGDMRIAPRQVADSNQNPTGQDMAAVWQSTMEYFLDVQQAPIGAAMDLFNVCVEEFGYCGLLPDWQKKQRMELKKMTFQILTDTWLKQQVNERQAAAQEAGQNPDEVLTPEVVQALTEQVTQMLEDMLAAQGPAREDQVALVQLADPLISDREARRVISNLRKSAGEEVEYQVPKDEGGVPVTKVLVPWINFIHAHDMTGEGGTDWFSMPEYLTETEIEVRSAKGAENWNPKAKKKLLESQKNKLFNTLYTGVGSGSGGKLQGWIANGVGVGLEASSQALEQMPRWLVIYQYRRVVDSAGLPRIIKCIFHPAMQEEEDLIMWQETDHEKLPLMVETAEPVAYAMLARGACDIILDKQNFVKDMFDSEGARGQLGSNPPLLRGAKDHVGVKPGKELFARRSGTSFEASEFMLVPPVDQGTFKMIELVERAVNRYYFDAEDTTDEARQRFSEWVMFRAVRVYRELLRGLWKCVQQNVEELQVSSIAGRAVSLTTSRDQLQGEADIHIGVHLDGYGDDAADKFIKVYGQMVQNDRGGNVNASEGMQIIASLLSPMYARRLVLSAPAAAGQIQADQELRITKIMAGIPVDYQDNVSAPGLRLQVLQQWAQTPGNMQKAQNDPTIALMLQKEEKMLQFQQQQQTTNKQTERTGVPPNTPEELDQGK